LSNIAIIKEIPVILQALLLHTLIFSDAVFVPDLQKNHVIKNGRPIVKAEKLTSDKVITAGWLVCRTESKNLIGQ